MRLIVGLGNPGRKYARTRHNIGFLCLEAFASQEGVKFKKNKKLLGQLAQYADAKLLKPTTFMNLSGDSIRAAVDYFDIDAEEVLVVHDDLDLATGELRLRYKGGAGGHKGLRSILTSLGVETFNRVRFGIGRPDGLDPRDYVLSRFHKAEGDAVINGIERTKEIIRRFAGGEDFQKLMNEYN